MSPHRRFMGRAKYAIALVAVVLIGYVHGAEGPKAPAIRGRVRRTPTLLRWPVPTAD